MNKQGKHTTKKLLRRAEALPLLRHLKPLTDRLLRIQGIKEECRQLRGCREPVVLFGINRLSLSFYRKLKAQGNRAYLVALDHEALPPEYSNAGLPWADLLYLREEKPRFYSMAASRDGFVKSRLLELGFRPQEVKRLGYGTIARIRGVRLADSKDPLLGSVRTQDSPLPGYAIFQNSHSPEALRILILGGSTSDPTLMNLKSWSEYLFDSLSSMEIPTVIYNGAVGGYTSSQELKKLMRDLPLLRPHLVISLSGVNDAAGIYTEGGHPLYQREDRREALWLVKKRKARNELQAGIPLSGVSLGPEDNRSLFQVWLDNERSMHAIAAEFDADFHAFLQPIKELNAVKTAFYRDAKVYFRRQTPPWLHDYSRLFDSDKAVFADFCHVYEKGNRILCRAMLRYVLEYLDDCRPGRETR